MLDNYQKLIELIRNDRMLITDINKLLHSNLKIPFNSSISDIEKPKKSQFQSKIQDCFNILRNKNPAKLDRIIEYLEENPKQSQDPLYLAEKLLKQFKDILSDEHELYNEISKILNEFVISEKQKKQNDIIELEPDEYYEENPNDSGYGPVNNHKKITKTIRPAKKNVNNYQYSQTHVQEINENGENSNNFISNNNMGNYVNISSNLSTIPVAMKNEWHFFENIKVKLSHNQHEDLIKCIFLYSECVISSYELFTLTKEIFKDYELFYIFRDIMLSRENSRRKMTPFFKPIGEIDLSSKY